MRIFLGNSPWLDENDPQKYGVRAGSRWPHFQKKAANEKIGSYVPFPHFLASATALLEAEGEDVLLVDGVAEGISVNSFIDKIKDFEPRLVLLEVSTPSIEYDLKIAKKIKSECGKPEIIFCGIHAPMHSEEFLAKNPVVDYILYGEYEHSLRELVKNRTNGREYENVKGLVFRETTGNIKINERRPLIKDLDLLPPYAHQFLPMQNYKDMPCGLPAPSVQMWTSRGCPFQCSFCAWPQIIYGGNKYRVRSVSKILDELEFLINKYNFKSFYFDDDTVNIGKKRMLELSNEIIKRKINLPWAIMARADTMDRELLTAFKNAGLYSLKYGVESGDQKLINDSGKMLDLDKVKESISITKELGIKIHLTFAFGLPGETKETIKKTTELALELDPDSIQFSLITPFPGSRLYNTAKEMGWLVEGDWSKFNGSSSSVSRTKELTTEDLEMALKNAYEKWTIHKRDKVYNAIKNKIKGEYLKQIEGIGKTIIIRSSYLGHFESILELITHNRNNKVSVLGQPAIEDSFCKDDRIERIFVYGSGFLSEKQICAQMVEEIIREGFDTAIILYNNSPRETYSGVESAVKAFKTKQIVGVDTEGVLWKL